MSRRKPLVQNAADPKQRRFAEHVEKQRVRRRDETLRAVMNTEAGRAFVWSEIRRHGVFESPFDLHGTVQSHKIGRGDAGRELMAEVLSINDGKLYLVMESEGRAAEAREQAMIDASHIPNADADEGEQP